MEVQMMDDSLEFAAREMVSYYGSQAVAIATRRAADLARRGEWPAQDRAMRMLTQIESLTSRCIRDGQVGCL
jgi:hypothetical protein